MESPVDLINALDVTGDDIFNGLDLVLLPLLLTCAYYFIKYVVIEHNKPDN